MAFQAPSARARPQLPLPRPSSRLEVRSRSSTFLTPNTEDEEWVVFSPSSIAETPTISATNQLSRTSEVGSYYRDSPDALPGSFDEFGAASEDAQEEEEDDVSGAETDSLQAFQEPVGLFPTHDGLGSFGSAATMTGYRSLEESLRIVASSTDNDRDAMINKWRMEQSEAFLNEVERATRRRRLSSASRRSASLRPLDTSAAAVKQADEESAACMSPKSATTATGDSEPFWKRITRSFIRDIIGIDDSLLEVIFGEALPAEATTPTEASPTTTAPQRRDIEDRLLDRIAKELGELMHLYKSHPSVRGAPPTTTRPVPSRQDSVASKATHASGIPNYSFAPTLPSDTHEALWGIEEAPPSSETSTLEAQLRREYWENEMDMRLVLSFLKARLYPATAPQNPPPPASPVSMRFNHPLINRRPSYLRNAKGPKSATTSVSTKSKGYYWDVATSVGSGKTGVGSCVGTGVWAAI